MIIVYYKRLAKTLKTVTISIKTERTIYCKFNAFDQKKKDFLTINEKFMQSIVKKKKMFTDIMIHQIKNDVLL